MIEIPSADDLGQLQRASKPGGYQPQGIAEARYFHSRCEFYKASGQPAFEAMKLAYDDTEARFGAIDPALLCSDLFSMKEIQDEASRPSLSYFVVLDTIEFLSNRAKANSAR